MTILRVLIGLLCSLGGLGLGAWLTAVCLLAPAAHLIALAAWPLLCIGALGALGGAGPFPAPWWVIALFAGFPDQLFTLGWFAVIADEGQRNPAWVSPRRRRRWPAPSLAACLGQAPRWQRARQRRGSAAIAG